MDKIEDHKAKVEEIKVKKVVKNKNNKSNVGINTMIFFLGVLITVIGFYVFKDELFYVESTSNGICYTACENKVTINEKGISDAVEKIYDAVVLVENYKDNQVYLTGTGFFYKIDEKYGYILTNYHVINGNTSINIVLSDETQTEGIYLGGDEYLDIAIVAVDKDKVLKVAEIGNSGNTSLGDTVFTVGTPIDYEYRGTVTRGILSGKNRLVSVNASKTNTNDAFVMKVLQTDAAINPGNSGGPLVNVNGEVIGINSLKLAKEEIEGMGFAIAIEDVMIHVPTLEKGKKIQRPLLGISMVNVTDKYTLYQLGIKIDTKINTGVVVTSVENNSSVFGVLKVGDVVVKLNDVETPTLAYLRYQLYRHKIGEEITLTYIRDGKEITSNVTLKG